MFWNVRAMPRRLIWCGDSPAMLRPSRRIVPALGRVDAGDQVEDGGLAGAVRADQADAARPASSAKSRRRSTAQAAEAQRAVVELQQRHRSDLAHCPVQRRTGLRPQIMSTIKQQRVDDHAVLGAEAQQLGQDGEHDRGRDDRAGDAAQAAEHDHDDDLDAAQEGERVGVDVADEVREQPAGHARQERADGEGEDLVARGVDAHRRGGDLVLADGEEAPCRARE